MARDYKNTGRHRSRKKRGGNGAPVWLVFGTGLATGLFVAAVVFLQQEKDQHTTAQALPNQAKTPATRPTAPAKKPAPVEHLDIPTPEKEREKVVIQLEQTRAEKQQEPKVQVNEVGGVKVYTFYDDLEKGQELPLPETQVQQRKGDLYVLQAGSFRRWEDADRMRARLALLNVESKVQTVTMDNGEIWHRVRVGPYSSYREVDKLRRRMQSGNINSMLMTIRKDS